MKRTASKGQLDCIGNQKINNDGGNDGDEKEQKNEKSLRYLDTVAAIINTCSPPFVLVTKENYSINSYFSAIEKWEFLDTK